jgi:hypothetical protein
LENVSNELESTKLEYSRLQNEVIGTNESFEETKKSFSTLWNLQSSANHPANLDDAKKMFMLESAKLEELITGASFFDPPKELPRIESFHRAAPTPFPSWKSNASTSINSARSPRQVFLLRIN